MKYLDFINKQICKTVLKPKKIVLFGQNITAGSHLGGLTKKLQVNDKSKIINSTNSENSLCGFGFGLMMNNVSSVFFMKQLDFLLLGIDHLVNTYNIIRSTKNDLKSSFTIMPIIVDNGYQGPQSSFNNFADICSIARIPGYAISTKFEAEKIISEKLISPGFRIIGISQRLFKNEINELRAIKRNKNLTLIQYAKGSNVTIVCFNFSFSIGYELLQKFHERKIKSSLFNITSLVPISWKTIIEDVKKTKNLIVIDDSKSQNVACDNLISQILINNNLINVQIIRRSIDDNWLKPNLDNLEINVSKIIKKLSN